MSSCCDQKELVLQMRAESVLLSWEQLCVRGLLPSGSSHPHSRASIQIDQVPGPPQAPPMSQQFSTTVPGPPQAAPMAGQLPTTVPGTSQAIPIPSQSESYFRMQSDCEQLCVRSPVGRGSEVIAILLRGLSKATNSQQKSSLPDFIGIAKFYTGVLAVLGWLAPEKEMALLAAADKLVRYACNGLVLLACSFRCEAQAA
jgi:hypothetical protein